MKGLKKYFSPPQVALKSVETPENVSKKQTDASPQKKNDQSKDISDDIIVKNMEEVLKSISKKRKKEKHKRKHHHHKDKKQEKETEEREGELSIFTLKF